MTDPTAPRGIGNGLAPMVTHPLNHHYVHSDTLISYQSFILSSGNELPNETNDDALFQVHIDEASVAYANKANTLLQLFPTSQHTFIDTIDPGSSDNKNSLLTVHQHLDPQSSHAPTLPIPLNTRSIHVPTLDPYLPTTLAPYLPTAQVTPLLVKTTPIL